MRDHQVDRVEMCLAHQQGPGDLGRVQVDIARDGGAAQIELVAHIGAQQVHIAGNLRFVHGQVTLDSRSDCAEPTEDFRVGEGYATACLDSLQIDSLLEQAAVEPKVVPEFGVAQIDDVRKSRAD